MKLSFPTHDDSFEQCTPTSVLLAVQLRWSHRRPGPRFKCPEAEQGPEQHGGGAVPESAAQEIQVSENSAGSEKGVSYT